MFCMCQTQEDFIFYFFGKQKQLFKEEAVLNVPLSNPFDRDIRLSVFRDGLYIYGDDSIELKSKTKGKYELKFCPKRKGKFGGRLVCSFFF